MHKQSRTLWQALTVGKQDKWKDVESHKNCFTFNGFSKNQYLKFKYSYLQIEVIKWTMAEKKQGEHENKDTLKKPSLCSWA